MNMSFWTGAVGAENFTKRLAITSNNLANINTTGYKAKSAPFRELINYNLNDSREAITELQAGAGAVVHQTNMNFRLSGLNTTNISSDYALMDDNAFFMLQDPGDGSISYTRNGHFHSGLMEDGEFYLMTESGKYVLDQKGEKLKADVLDFDTLKEKDENATEQTTENTAETEEKPTVGVYTFPHPSRLLSKGDNEFIVQEGDTQNVASLIRNPHVVQGAIESSSTDLAKEMTKIIESQRAFSYALKMVTTSDEVENTVNNLR
ncbi:flagellar hook-basal body protein [Lachnospiraceae bacterium JC7]|nr:flagellar hook-basal body protein [Lachnospiraceae bacterium JC7]